MAEKLMVTRQAVSRWETGETVPNTDTLKLISRVFDVSINTLLGAPRTLMCQCCGMPLYEDAIISREQDGAFNEDYCKWCYADGQYAYQTVEAVVEACLPHMTSMNPGATEADVRKQLETYLPSLKHWNAAKVG